MDVAGILWLFESVNCVLIIITIIIIVIIIIVLLTISNI